VRHEVRHGGHWPRSAVPPPLGAGRLYTASAITGCRGGTCANAASTFGSRLAITSPYPIVYELGIGLILAVPAIIGVFRGAPGRLRSLKA